MHRMAWALTLFLGFVGAALADERVDLELVLLADASGSIDDAEIRFQRQGYAAAITDPAVVAAIENTLYGSIAVTCLSAGSYEPPPAPTFRTVFADPRALPITISIRESGFLRSE